MSPRRPAADALLRWGLGVGILICWLCRPAAAAAGHIPPWLPRYDLDIHLQVPDHAVVVHERVTWTNPCDRPTARLVFNVASHYAIPDNEVGFLAKMLEILRLTPGGSRDFEGPACPVRRAAPVAPPVPLSEPRRAGSGGPLPDGRGSEGQVDLAFAFRADNATALEVQLPAAVGP